MKSIDALRESKDYQKHRIYQGADQVGDLFYFEDGSVISVFNSGKLIRLSYQDVCTQYKKRQDKWKCIVSYKYKDYPVYYLTEEEMDNNIGQFIEYHQNKEADL